MHKPELLSPAGNMEKLEVAVAYGADAVYLGGSRFGLRTAAASFDVEKLQRAVSFAHAQGVRVYVTVNIFAHNRDIAALPGYLKELQQLEVDAVIASDPGVIELAAQAAPGLPVHLSTQANTTNWMSARFWEQRGIKRIVLARELSLDELREISSKVGLELEVFVHGAMCISYSGRCLLSNYMTGRDANWGDCAQACRWKYALMEEKRPGEYFPFGEDARGSFIMSSKDLCLLEHIPNLLAAGISSFKIEGRVKSIHYVATITKIYRRAIDAYWADPDNYHVYPEWIEEIGKVSNREYITGFIDGPPGKSGFVPVEGIYQRSYTFVGVVKGYDHTKNAVKVEQRNHFSRGESLEVMPPIGKEFKYIVHQMYDEDGSAIDRAPHPRQTVYLPGMPQLPHHTMLRRAESS